MCVCVYLFLFIFIIQSSQKLGGTCKRVKGQVLIKRGGGVEGIQKRGGKIKREERWGGDGRADRRQIFGAR